MFFSHSWQSINNVRCHRCRTGPGSKFDSSKDRQVSPVNTKKILVVEDNPLTLRVIEDTFSEAGAGYIVVTTDDDAWALIEANADFTQALIRMDSESIDGCRLCQRIRNQGSLESLPILMIVDEDQLESAARAIEAGATDILIDPFEPRDLRMRTNVYPSPQRKRVDQPHSWDVANAASSQVSAASTRPCQTFPGVVTPKFDPVLQRFTYGASEEQIAAWKNDESVTKIVLDRILVCPCCNGVPTFRMGCGSCGSGMTEPDVLIHHYACAHVGAESEYRKGSDLVCPKCRQTNLIAGSDFETVSGGQVCADCHSRISETELIGHCLSCQHRFPAVEAATMQLTAFQVHRVREIVSEETGQSPITTRAVREFSATQSSLSQT